MPRKRTCGRRDFMKTAGKSALLLGLAPMIVSNRVLAQNKDSALDTIVVGVVGLGWRGMDLLHDAFRCKELQVAAVADVDRSFLLRGMKECDDFYGIERKEIQGEGGSARLAPKVPKQVDGYEDYRRILDRSDIDAMIIAVPDHWHGLIAVQSCEAGKDVYCEKPLSLVIEQGRRMVRAARTNNRVFQVGSQQRSNDKFRLACEAVRSGRIGKILKVDVCIEGSPQRTAVPDEPVPPGLDWDFWLGPAPYVPYNPERARVNFRWFFDYSGGMVTDWGAHHLDIAQWGLGTDLTGPRFVEGTGETSAGFYETLTSWDVTFTYANGIPVHFYNGKHGITFFGEKGQIFVKRGEIKATPEEAIAEPIRSDEVRLYKSEDHMQNWVDCIKSRQLPITDVEIGHRSVTLCHLANIVCKLKRKLEWDPDKEMFVHDREANQFLARPMREPWHF
ncbi:MAG TPA: Gfo/Idh/MocA family oxidoreductase [bacterium]|nr:Gfo/Idh/MocA family oxidoreductase [bacterium]HQL61691.1 Gfo/Idh/MocA family oxidoreductase [bacterium]